MATAAITPFHRAKLEAAFDREDRNGDGQITPVDFTMMAKDIAEKSGKPYTKEMEEKWLTIYSMYYKDSPNTEAFVQNTFQASKVVPREQAIAAQKPMFDVIDLDGNGLIDKKEWEIYLSCINVSPEDAAKSFDIIDTDKDGTLSVEELAQAIVGYYFDEEPNDYQHVFGPFKFNGWLSLGLGFLDKSGSTVFKLTKSWFTTVELDGLDMK